MAELEKLRQYLDSFTRQLQIPLGVCLCTQNHRRILSHTTGSAPEYNGEVFWIYSATKVVTAVAAMQMVEAGLLDLSAPVSRYLPEYEHLSVKSGKDVLPLQTQLLVEHLLTMQGGFNYQMDPPAVNALHPAACTQQVIAAYRTVPLDFIPGTHFQYSLCLDILGGVLEAACGMTLGQWMKEHIFSPLEMYNTGFVPPPHQSFVPQFQQTPDGDIRRIGNENFCRVTSCYESGGGGLYSTPEDYSIFADALACGGVGANGYRILTQKSIDAMCRNRLHGQSLQDFRKRYTRPGYGYGLGVRASLGDGTAQPKGVFGWDGAAGAHVLIDPQRQLSLVYFQHVLDMEILYDDVFAQMDNLLYEV